jgi:cell wall-associated NlpC family hydrolase
VRNKIQFIAQEARREDLDPRAVLSIAQHEGLSGAVGDNGTSFGPFQLHEGGALPSGIKNPQQWAWSKQGIDYALSRMAAAGARGLTGRAAISAISRNFERPADPASEIADAVAHYSSFGNLGGGSFARGGGALIGGGSKVGVRFDSATYKKQAAQLILQNAVSQAQGQPLTDANGQPTDLLTQLDAAKRAATQRLRVGVGAPKPSGPTGVSGGSTGARAVRMAMKQLGQPYVWGGESRKSGGFDCSGLVQWAYGSIGVKLPRTAAQQGSAGKRINYGALRKGDLLVENNGDHVVMYAGGGRVIQAPHTGTNVQMSPISWFPQSQYYAVRPY